MRIDSLRTRLVVLALIWAVAATAAAGWALSYSFRQTVERNLDQQLVTLLLALVGSVEANPDGSLAPHRALGDARFEQVYSGWYWAVTDGTAAGLRSRSLWDLDLKPAPAPMSAEARFRNGDDTQGRRLRIAEQTVRLPGARAAVTFMVTADTAAIGAEVAAFNRTLILGLAALALGLVLAVLVQVTVGLRPLRKMTADVEAVRAGSTGQLASTGIRELDLLGSAVNELIADNRRVIERSRASAADLAHALKTPLAVLRTTLAEDSATGILNDLQGLIDRQLSRAAAAGPQAGVTTPLRPVVEALFLSLRRIHRERDPALQYDGAPDLRFPGDRQDAEEILGNLLDNACKWCRRRVHITASSMSGRLRLRIEDDGPGIEPHLAATATARGTRLDHSVPGSGLGLAIVADLVEIYGGTLTLDTATLGGLGVTVELPMRRDGAAGSGQSK